MSSADMKYDKVTSLCESIQNYAYDYLFGKEMEMTPEKIKSKKFFMQSAITQLFREFCADYPVR